MIRRFRIYLAGRKLQRLLEKRRASFAHQDFLRRRKAALSHRPHILGLDGDD